MNLGSFGYRAFMGSYVFNGSVDVYLKVKLNLQRLMFLMAVLIFF